MTDRHSVDSITSDALDELYARAAQVRALHQPIGVVAAAEFGMAPDCNVCGPYQWPCATYTAVTEDEPGPAATEATKPRTTPNSLREQLRTTLTQFIDPDDDCMPTLAADGHGFTWVPADDVLDQILAVILPGARITATLARMPEADVSRVIALYETWVKAGPPPLGTSLSRWWDRRLAELHAAINPPKDQPHA